MEAPVPFNPRTAMFMADSFVMDVAANGIDNGGRFPMMAELADRDSYTCRTKGGQAMEIYTIRRARQDEVRGSGAFLGYWCPYVAGQTHYTTLTGLAHYMFTATMDGCSFGMGSQASDGTCVVSHSNQNQLETRTSKDAMIAAQKAALVGRLGTTSTLFQPKDYRSIGTFWKTTGISAATFGVFDGGKWKFYAHRYRKDMGSTGVIYTVYDTVTLRA